MTSPRALILGGTGIISAAIVEKLMTRGMHVTVFNRGQRATAVPHGVDVIQGDRNDVAAFVQTFERQRFDVVYDMICYAPEQAEASVRAFAGRCEQLVFCSSAVVYGAKTPPPNVLLDETTPLTPISGYGKSKVLCEQVFLRAAERGDFQVAIARAGQTYGPGDSLDDQVGEVRTWDRVVRGLPVLCTGDGLGLWVTTHRDDVAKFFAYAALSPRTYGEAFNVMRDEVLTWRRYYAEDARALDTRATLLFVPASWLIAQDPERFEFLATMSQFHGAYSSAKAKAAVPEFRATIGLEAGARQVFADMRRRGAWPDSTSDAAYQQVVDRALAAGFRVEDP